MNEQVGIAIASEFASGISVSLQTNGSTLTPVQGKGKLQEFWIVPVSVVDTE